MSGELKNKKRISVALPFATIDRLQAHKEKTDVPTSITIDKAINQYLDEKTKEK